MTKAGQALVRDLEAAQINGLSEVLHRLPPAERKDVIRGLERLVSAARGDAE